MTQEKGQSMPSPTSEASHPEDPDQHQSKPATEIAPTQQEATIRLHLWLETAEGVFFGTGRALLLVKIEQYGSLKKAAEDLGMSYRAAWGKIRKTEEVLGVRLIAQKGCKKGGHRLTEHGELLKEKYLVWFQDVERWALRRAQELFSWPVRSFEEKAPGKTLQSFIAFWLSLPLLAALVETVL